jgi:hypothetical protein
VLDRRVDLAGRMEIVDQKSPKITSEQLVKLLMEKCPELGEKIIAALNDAPDGLSVGSGLRPGRSLALREWEFHRGMR